MIPYRMAFSGIRDYRPTVVDLSGEKEHILISGANGAGKSTLTFCWGAVMASGKVNLEGLRSKNLPEQQVWQAKIELTFQNNGSVDAAKYVKFTLLLEQQPHGPIKREYEIAEGDEVDEWEHTLRFTSSHKSFDFQEYKRQLLQKYALDPDAFYLIWYQQDVNQFAVMRPEERFRIFSEMTGIEEMQKRLESIKEREKELAGALQDARNNQRQYGLDLGYWEQERNKYADQQRRLQEGFQQYVTALCTLEAQYEQERGRYQEELGRYRLLVEEKQAECSEKESALQQLSEQVQKQEALFRQYDQVLEQLEQQLSAEKERQRGLKREMKRISDEMQEITEKIKRLPLTSAQVRQTLAEQEVSLRETERERESVQRQLNEVTSQQQHLTQEIARLAVSIENDQKEEVKAANYLRQYTSSYALRAELDSAEDRLRTVKDEQHALARELAQLEAERKNLTLNYYVSSRQQQSLHYFKELGIRAYTLRDLIELTEEAEPQAEIIFETVKYSMFVEAKQFTAPNDLYHVPLPLLVPTESVVALPKYFLRIKETLADELVPVAMKALWWLKQFVTDTLPVIRETGLHDQRGVRGAQEPSAYILSEKAIKARLVHITAQLEQGLAQQRMLVQEADRLGNREKELRGIIHQVEQAEAFLHQRSERTIRVELHETKDLQLLALYQEENQLRHRQQHLHTVGELLKQERDKLLGYQSVYEEYEKEADNIQRIQRLQGELDALEQRVRELEDEQAKLTDESNAAERAAQRLKRKQGDEKADLQALQRYTEDLQERLRNSQDRYLHYEKEWQEAVTAKKDFRSSYPDILAQLQEAGWQEAAETWTELEAKSIRQGAWVTFNGARNETVNPLAPENYAKMKEEYERSNHEVTQSQRMVEEIQEHLAGATERLELAIRMGVRKIHDRFECYMEQFHFEGEVTWEMAENRRGEIRYYLYIKARKKGHRGKLEDISAKGRGGKVGSGVSGGEESLSSLLFALALLQTIEASPGYIILDEYDSALDDNRKEKVFTLFEQELGRKMIIVSPKSHDPKYLEHFAKAFTVIHDAGVPVSRLIKVKKAVMS